MGKTLKNILYLLSASFVAKFIGTFTAFAVAKILQPSEYGIWINLLLISLYSPIVTFGTLETLLKQFPYLIGKGELAEARLLERIVLMAVSISALLLLVIGFIFPVFIQFHLSASNIWQAQVIVAASAISFFSAYFLHRFTANQNFTMVSLYEAGRAIFTFLFLILCGYFWGLKGLVLGYLGLELFILFSLAPSSYKVCGAFGLKFDWRLMWDCIKIGFPITAFWWIFIVQTSVDRIVSISMLGELATGYYGLGVSILSAIILLPQAITRVLYPKVNERVALTRGGRELMEIVVMPARALSYLIPLMIGILIIVMPFVYVRLLPKYIPGLVSGQILVIGSYFRLLVGVGVNFLIAIDKQKTLLGYVIISLVANIVGAIMLIKVGFNIEGIAVSTGISGLILFTLVWRAVFREMGYSLPDQIKSMSDLFLPFALVIILIVSLCIVVPTFLNETEIALLWHGALFVGVFIAIVSILPPFKKSVHEMYFLLLSGARSIRQI